MTTFLCPVCSKTLISSDTYQTWYYRKPELHVYVSEFRCNECDLIIDIKREVEEEEGECYEEM